MLEMFSIISHCKGHYPAMLMKWNRKNGTHNILNETYGESWVGRILGSEGEGKARRGRQCCQVIRVDKVGARWIEVGTDRCIVPPVLPIPAPSTLTVIQRFYKTGLSNINMARKVRCCIIYHSVNKNMIEHKTFGQD